MTDRRPKIEQAIEHLKRADAALGGAIEAVGPYTLRLERDRFSMLVRSIISQQISTGAARSIRSRLELLTHPEKPTAEGLARLTDRKLRSVGISSQKLAYLRDLASKVLAGQVCLAKIGRKTNEEVIEELVQVKGIGVWTAQMFLIFSLGRLDVLPCDDLGVRSAIRDLHGLDDLPDRKTCESIGRAWQPYASVASWYCWRSVELNRRAKSQGNGYPA